MFENISDKPVRTGIVVHQVKELHLGGGVGMADGGVGGGVGNADGGADGSGDGGGDAGATRTIDGTKEECSDENTSTNINEAKVQVGSFGKLLPIPKQAKVRFTHCNSVLMFNIGVY